MDLSLIDQSISWRRQKVADPNQALRMFAGISDGIEGLLIEQYGPFILASFYNPELYTHKKDILNKLITLFPERSILLKMRDPKDPGKFIHEGNDLYNKEAIYECLEEDLKFEIHTDPRHDFGLYLDTKASRKIVRGMSENKNILNLFSYTCAFGIAAIKGGAASVTNIDPNKEYLAWGQNSANLNGVTFKKYPDTTQDYLARHLRRLESGKDQAYDLIIIDPPAFLVGRGSHRLARNLWPTWMYCLKKSQCLTFLFVINDKSLGRSKNLESFFHEGLGKNISIERVPQSFDVEGQGVSLVEDNFYFNPEVFLIKR